MPMTAIGTFGVDRGSTSLSGKPALRGSALDCARAATGFAGAAWQIINRIKHLAVARPSCDLLGARLPALATSVTDPCQATTFALVEYSRQ